MKKVVLRGYDLATARIIETALCDFWSKQFTDSQLIRVVTHQEARTSVLKGGLGQSDLKQTCYASDDGVKVAKIKLDEVNVADLIKNMPDTAAREYFD